MRAIWTLAAVAAGVCGVIAAPATLASAETPQDVINRLQGEGYTVHVDRVGTAPLSECEVTNIRNPKRVTQWVPYVGPGDRDGDALVLAIISQSISVTLNCSR